MKTETIAERTRNSSLKNVGMEEYSNENETKKESNKMSDLFSDLLNLYGQFNLASNIYCCVFGTYAFALS